jgi:hypothetical protein
MPRFFSISGQSTGHPRRMTLALISQAAGPPSWRPRLWLRTCCWMQPGPETTLKSSSTSPTNTGALSGAWIAAARLKSAAARELDDAAYEALPALDRRRRQGRSADAPGRQIFLPDRCPPAALCQRCREPLQAHAPPRAGRLGRRGCSAPRVVVDTIPQLRSAFGHLRRLRGHVRSTWLPAATIVGLQTGLRPNKETT